MREYNIDISSDDAGIFTTVKYMWSLAVRDSNNDIVKNLVLKLKGKSNLETIKNIYNYVYKNFKYINDPSDRELVIAPIYILDGTMKGGDCDDLTTLLVSLLRSAGFTCSIKVIAWRLWAFTHVIAEVLIDGFWIPLDPTRRESGFGKQETNVKREKRFLEHDVEIVSLGDGSGSGEDWAEEDNNPPSKIDPCINCKGEKGERGEKGEKGEKGDRGDITYIEPYKYDSQIITDVNNDIKQEENSNSNEESKYDYNSKFTYKRIPALSNNTSKYTESDITNATRKYNDMYKKDNQDSSFNNRCRDRNCCPENDNDNKNGNTINIQFGNIGSSDTSHFAPVSTQQEVPYEVLIEKETNSNGNYKNNSNYNNNSKKNNTDNSNSSKFITGSTISPDNIGKNNKFVSKSKMYEEYP